MDKRLCFTKEEIKELSQVFKDVEEQLKKSRTTHPSLEAYNQETFICVSYLKLAEPESAGPIQEDQAKGPSPIIQKEEQPVQDVMVTLKQYMVEN
ncbi:hypothetical protein F2Q69_00058826 [Brassica cretica]|uniref:Uncharacterized protein n=1 Tax=Brassica cretica TaxID=69181 RepID=A0A8S9RFD3_BRACR|nr:hypothetical protein F2Q69_00058826 [Brassica cretica]